jgi:hypothetical protein
VASGCHAPTCSPLPALPPRAYRAPVPAGSAAGQSCPAAGLPRAASRPRLARRPSSAPCPR